MVLRSCSWRYALTTAACFLPYGTSYYLSDIVLASVSATVERSEPTRAVGDSNGPALGRPSLLATAAESTGDECAVDRRSRVITSIIRNALFLRRYSTLRPTMHRMSSERLWSQSTFLLLSVRRRNASRELSLLLRFVMSARRRSLYSVDADR